MPRCMNCGDSIAGVGICTDCATAKWYVAVIYYALIFVLVAWVATSIIHTVDNIGTLKTAKEFGAGQYFRNIAHIHDDSWIGTIKADTPLYAYNDLKNPTDSIMMEAGMRYEHWGYRKYNDSVSVVCARIYSDAENHENYFIRVPERWGWFRMQFSPSSDYIVHNVTGRIEKLIIDEYYADPRVAALVVRAEGKSKIKQYKADKKYRKMKSERSLSTMQKILIFVVEGVFMPDKRQKDFILKEDYKKLKKIRKEYFNDDRIIEEYLAQN